MKKKTKGRDYLQRTLIHCHLLSEPVGKFGLPGSKLKSPGRKVIHAKFTKIHLPKYTTESTFKKNYTNNANYAELTKVCQIIHALTFEGGPSKDLTLKKVTFKMPSCKRKSAKGTTILLRW